MATDIDEDEDINSQMPQPNGRILAKSIDLKFGSYQMANHYLKFVIITEAYWCGT